MKPPTGRPIEVERALAALTSAVEPPVETEVVDLAAAVGRVLAQDVAADRDFPPADLSAMDGYALRSADAGVPGAVLRIRGEVRAGRPPEAGVEPGTAVRIMTGAIVPAGADAVVMVERTAVRGDAVEIVDAVVRGQNVRQRGCEARRGTVVLEAGTSVRAAEVAALASVGRARPRVYRLPRVAVLSTGDEIVPAARDEIAPHEIRNSNVPALRAMLAAMGIDAVDLGNVRDDRPSLDARIADGLAHDLLLVTGGVSAGTYDLVSAGLAARGATILFHGVAMKPGKPVLAARGAAGLAVGLPGNPVSACTVFAVLVAPALRRRMGLARWESPELLATLDEPLSAKAGRTTYHLARFETRGRRLHARAVDSRGSGDVLSMARADGWVVTPSTGGEYPAGSELPALGWGGWPGQE
jgi:molybdopterin molybdotransferase